MKKRILSLLITAAMIASMATVAFAAPETVNYVALGDSCSNGYGMEGYYADGINGYNYYGYGIEATYAYPTLVKEALEAQGYDVNLSQLAISGMRTEELHAILDDDYSGDAYTDYTFLKGESGMDPSDPVHGSDNFDEWGRYCVVLGNGTGTHVSGTCDCEETLRAQYVEAIENADLISINLGTNTFGTIFIHELMNTLADGWDGSIPAYDELGLATLLNDPAILAEYNKVLDYAKTMLPAKYVDLADLLAYSYVSYIVNYMASLEHIREINPTATLVIVGLNNLVDGVVLDMGAELGTIDMGALVDYMATAANTFISALNIADKNALYVEVEDLDLMLDVLIRDNENATGEINSVFATKLAEQFAALTAGIYGGSPSDYMAIWTAYISGDASVRAYMSGLDPMVSALAGVWDAFTAAASETELDMVETMTTMGGPIAGYLSCPDLLHLMARATIAEGIGIHPSEVGHAQIAAGIMTALNDPENNTAGGFAADNIAEALMAAYAFIVENHNEIYAYAWALAYEQGYIAEANAYLDAAEAAVAGLTVDAEISDELAAELVALQTEVLEDIDAVRALINTADHDGGVVPAFESLMTDLYEDLTALCEIAQRVNTDSFKQLLIVHAQVMKQLGVAKEQAYTYICGQISTVYETIKSEIIKIAEQYGPDACAFVQKYLIDNPTALYNTIMAYGQNVDAFLTYWGRYAELLFGPAWNAYGDDIIGYAKALAADLTADLEKVAAEMSAEAYEILVAYVDSLQIPETFTELAVGLKDAMLNLGTDTDAQLTEIVMSLSVIEENYDAVVETLIALYESTEVEEVKAVIKNAIDSILARETVVNAQLNAIRENVIAVKGDITSAVAAVNRLTQAVNLIKSIVEAPEQFDFEQTKTAISGLILEATNAYTAVETAVNAVVSMTPAVVAAADAVNGELMIAAAEVKDALGAAETVLATTGINAGEILKNAYAAAETFTTTTANKVITDATNAIAYCKQQVIDAITGAVAAVENALYYAVHADYNLDCESFYVSLGDSTVTGMNANNGTPPEGYGNYGYKTIVPASFAYKFAEKLGLEDNYIQLALAGLRTTDLRFILDENFPMDEFALNRTTERINVYAGGVDQMREDYRNYLSKADIITISLGNCNFTDFAGGQMNGVATKTLKEKIDGLGLSDNMTAQVYAIAAGMGIPVDGEYHEIKWDNYFDDRAMAVLNETVANIKNELIANNIPETVTIDVGAMLQPYLDAEFGTGVVTVNCEVTLEVMDLAIDIVESYFYGLIAYVSDYAVVLDMIHEIAPDAELMVLGMYNADSNLAIDCGDFVIEYGEYMGVFNKLINSYIYTYALTHENTTYVDVYDTESVFEAQMGDDTVFTLEEYFGIAAEHHASLAGHTYMAEQAYAALNVTGSTDHVYELVSDTATCEDDGVKTYTCSVCGDTYTVDSAATGHAWGNWVSVDDDNHQRVCANDASHVETEAHADANSDNACDKCGHDMTPDAPPAPPVVPDDPYYPPFIPVEPEWNWDCNGVGCGGSKFADLTELFASNPDLWYHEAVDYVVAKGLMNGLENNNFAPQISATRAMLITTLYRIAGAPAVSGEVTYNDVLDNAWYTDAIIWGTQNGIVDGVEGNNFAPNQAMTREQAATMFYRFAKFMGVDVSASADLTTYVDDEKVSAWAQDALEWANAVQLIRGREGNQLVPLGGTKRCELAVLLFRWCEEIAG